MGVANSCLTNSGPLRIGMLSVAGSDAQVGCSLLAACSYMYLAAA